MRQTYLLIVFMTFILTSCASTTPEEPKGEFLYFPIDEFFQGKTKEEVDKIYRKRFLECENEKLKIRIPILSPQDSVLPKFEALRDRDKYFDNCLELKGFEKKWVPQTILDEVVKELNKTKNYD